MKMNASEQFINHNNWQRRRLKLSWTNEDRLLLCLCRTNRTDWLKKEIIESERKGIDWDRLLKNTRDNGASGVVYRHLNAIIKDCPNIPLNIYEELKDDYYQTAAKNTVLFEELGKILKTLKKNRLQVIVLKGAALASIVYGNLALRSMSDIDLLVKKEDLFSLDKQMGLMDYRPVDKSVNDVDFSSTYLTTLDYRRASQDSYSFHIHWHFVNSTVPNESYIECVKMENVWQDAEKSDIANVETLVMAPHHFIIHLSEHALRVTHSLSKLSFMCDINEVIRYYQERYDWDRLIEESLKFNLEKFVYLGLYFTSRFLATEIPEKVLSKLRPKRPSLGEKIFMKSISNNKHFSGLSYLVHLSMNKGFLKKMKFIWRTFFPPRHIMAQRQYALRSKSSLIHYLRRIYEVLSRLPKILK